MLVKVHTIHKRKKNLVLKNSLAWALVTRQSVLWVSLIFQLEWAIENMSQSELFPLCISNDNDRILRSIQIQR